MKISMAFEKHQEKVIQEMQERFLIYKKKKRLRWPLEGLQSIDKKPAAKKQLKSCHCFTESPYIQSFC